MSAAAAPIRIRKPGLVHVAVFPLADRAAAFATRIAGAGWWVASVDHTPGRRTVRFTDSDEVARADDGAHACWRGMLETVGYFGSDDSRKATLDGHPAPRSY